MTNKKKDLQQMLSDYVNENLSKVKKGGPFSDTGKSLPSKPVAKLILKQFDADKLKH